MPGLEQRQVESNLEVNTLIIANIQKTVTIKVEKIQYNAHYENKKGKWNIRVHVNVNSKEEGNAKFGKDNKHKSSSATTKNAAIKAMVFPY